VDEASCSGTSRSGTAIDRFLLAPVGVAGVVPVAEPDTRLRRVDAISLTTGVVDLRPRRAPTISAVLAVIALIISAVLSLICWIRWRDNLVLDLRASGVISGTLFCLEAELSRST